MIPSRPAQAIRGAALVMTIAIACRLPSIEREFAAAMRSAGDQPDRLSMVSPAVAPSSPRMIMSVARNTQRVSTLRPTRHARRLRPEDRAEPRASAAQIPSPTFADSTVVHLASEARIRPVPVESPAFGLATEAYSRLAAGDRRTAVRLFDAALSFDDPRSTSWRRARNALTRRWSAYAYSIVRDGGSPTAATPILGGGQSGGGIAFTPAPLTTRPLSLTLRGAAAHQDPLRMGFVAVGVQWRPTTGVAIAAERLIGLTARTQNDWTARVAVGSDRRFGSLRETSYAEGGVIGSAGYLAGQTRLGPELHLGRATLMPSGGAWGSVQQGRGRGRIVDRLDLGPGLAAHAGPFAAAIDYRFRIAGNAAPGSGPVVTFSAAF